MGLPRSWLVTWEAFPGRIYFILNLGHFLKIFGTLDHMVEKLTWLPTWHQARLLCATFNIETEDVAAVWKTGSVLAPGEELSVLYGMLLSKLHEDAISKASRMGL
jgi:hypothetical protein